MADFRIASGEGALLCLVMRCHRLYILQSLPDSDKTRLAADLAMVTKVKSWFEVRDLQVNSAEQLLSLMRQVALDTSADGAYPMMHFEVHGSHEGFQIHPTDELVSWSDLWEVLVPIKVLTENRLLITLGSCQGDQVFRTIRHGKGSPFGYFIGPRGIISPTEVYEAFYTLYSELVQEGDIEKAIARSRVHDGRFSIATSEGIFEQFASLMADRLAPTRVDEALEAGYFTYSHGGFRGETWPFSPELLDTLRREHAQSWHRTFIEHYIEFFHLRQNPGSTSRYKALETYLGRLLEHDSLASSCAMARGCGPLEGLARVLRHPVEKFLPRRGRMPGGRYPMPRSIPVDPCFAALPEQPGQGSAWPRRRKQAAIW